MSRFGDLRARPEPEPEPVRSPVERVRSPAEEARAMKRRELQEITRKLRAAGLYPETFVRGDRRTDLASITLRPRDLLVIEFIAKVHLAPVDVLAQQFFAENPKSGRKNTNPERACIRRLDELMRAGYLVAATIPESPSHERGGRTYSLGRLGGSLMREPLRGVTPSRQHHHLQTLRHVELIRAEFAAEGRSIVKLELERGERASSERCAGNHIPDAILTLDDGATIAVEYVSTNYSDATIEMKGSHFASAYSQVRWSANSVATRNRVLRVMREACDVIV